MERILIKQVIVAVNYLLKHSNMAQINIFFLLDRRSAKELDTAIDWNTGRGKKSNKLKL
jgi:hypothetical protein